MGQSSFDHLMLIRLEQSGSSSCAWCEERGDGEVGGKEKEGTSKGYEICRLGQSFYRISTRSDRGNAAVR
jgi:hypothetical protein